MIDGKLVPTYEQFINIFAEFASIEDTRVQFFLDQSSNLIYHPIWKDQLFYAVCYEAAHNLAMAEMAKDAGGLQAGVGQITSASAAGMSTSFGQLSVKEGATADFWYSKTSYGQMFIRIRDVTIPPGVMAA